MAQGGESGSGKTHHAMSALHQLYCAAGGGPGTDAYKYLSATITVLAALTSAAIRSNPDSSRVSTEQGEAGMFEAECVLHQILSLQVTPTVQLMAAGLPHRLRYRAFNARYSLFLPSSQRNTGSSHDECQGILSQYLRAMDESRLPYVSTQWTLARKHIFYSEGTRQSLEAMRCESLNQAATCIHASWRGSRVRRSQDVRPVHAALRTFSAAQSPRPSLPPLGERTDSVELGVLLYLSQLNGMDLNHWPPVPPPRQYSVCGNVKVPSPHLRTLRHHYTDRENGVTLHTRDVVRVVGVSSQRGQLKVVHCGRTFHLPSHMLLLQPTDTTDSASLL